MADTKHTPGPWHVGGPTGLVNQVFIEPVIGAAYGAGDQVAANARLIAAAPELLEALQLIVSWNRKHAQDRHGDPDKAESWACVKAARAAIAKATGADHA